MSAPDKVPKLQKHACICNGYSNSCSIAYKALHARNPSDVRCRFVNLPAGNTVLGATKRAFWLKNLNVSEKQLNERNVASTKVCGLHFTSSSFESSGARVRMKTTVPWHAEDDPFLRCKEDTSKMYTAPTVTASHMEFDSSIFELKRTDGSARGKRRAENLTKNTLERASKRAKMGTSSSEVNKILSDLNLAKHLLPWPLLTFLLLNTKRCVCY